MRSRGDIRCFIEVMLLVWFTVLAYKSHDHWWTYYFPVALQVLVITLRTAHSDFEQVLHLGSVSCFLF